jgi:hypothetical protein
MDAELFDTEEVVSGGNAAWDAHRVGLCRGVLARDVCSLRTFQALTAQIPLRLATAESGTDLFDLGKN